ncbi:hypothetical protein GGS21DRAFT_305369 [Xylaria nigripes]|nr:hypothetical protein GGS21DRAFT_305369 [Xylaria nigripes]
MPMPEGLQEHPTPAQVYEVGVNFATLLRHLFTHPQFYFQEPPTATIAKLDPERTPKALFFVTDFIQNTYVSNVLPLLPPGITRRCKALANPWAYADSNYQWEWVWDAEAGAMKDVAGKVIEFPQLSSPALKDNLTDLFTRNLLAKKLITGSSSDPKARALLGGQAFDFGDDVRTAAEKLD